MTTFTDTVAKHLEDAGFEVQRNVSIPVGRAVKVTRSAADVDLDSLYPVPSAATFEGEFTPAPDLEKIADVLIERHTLYAGECNVVYLWKDKASKSKGKFVAGKCSKPSGLLRHFSHTDFVIWLAADVLRERTRREVEVALFHELKHIGHTEPPEDEEKLDAYVEEPALLGHDYEGFLDELTHYGTTVRDLRPIVATAQQLTLDV